MNTRPLTAVRHAHCSGPWAGIRSAKPIAGWREIVVPALRREQVAIWPFDGELRDLFQKFSLVIAETYPAEAYRHVGVRFDRHEQNEKN